MKGTLKQNTAILLITLLIVATIIVYLNFVKPTFEQIKNIQEEIVTTKEKIKVVTEYKAKAEQLISYYSNLINQVNNINLALPDNPQSDQILAIIDYLASKNNIVIDRINFEESQEDDGLGRVETRIDFVGLYQDFKNFLKDMENEIRLSDLRSINLKRPEEAFLNSKQSSKKGTSALKEIPLTGQVSFVFYYLAQ